MFRIKLVLSLVTLAVVGLVLAGGASSASAPRVQLFRSVSVSFTPVGFDANSHAAPPNGSGYVVSIVLFNLQSQFGKPKGARIGSAELTCTFVSELRNLCQGAAHTPIGQLTFSGANLNNAGKVQWYAITGGVGGYAGARGTIKVTEAGDNLSNVVVTLS
jgi:hypothetical protein